MRGREALVAVILLTIWPASRTPASQTLPNGAPPARAAQDPGHGQLRASGESQAQTGPAVPSGEPQTGPTVRTGEPETRPIETLSLEQAVALALEHNRQVRIAQLETEKSDERVSAARTKYYPVPQVYAMGHHLLSDVSFEFPEGAFGDFPATGPIPPQDTLITSTSTTTAFIDAGLTQPLTQLYRANLGVHLGEATLALDQEKLRRERQETASEVRKLYCSLLATGGSLASGRDGLEFYRELVRTVEEFVSQRAAMPSDLLDARAGLAAEEYRVQTLSDSLASGKERLNDLMGREITVDFEPVPLPAPEPLEQDLQASRAHAAERRPEIQEARLRVEQADFDRRMKKAEFIPDVSIGYGFTTNLNLEVVPRDISSVRLIFSWEIYDWGRKRRELAEKSWAREQAELALQSTRNAVLLDVGSRFRALTESRLAVAASEAAAEAAKEKSRVAMDRYKQRAILLKDLLQARSDAAEADSRHQESLLSVWSAKAEFERALGEE
jgi:outer membrane protein TolC